MTVLVCCIACSSNLHARGLSQSDADKMQRLSQPRYLRPMQEWWRGHVQDRRLAALCFGHAVALQGYGRARNKFKDRTDVVEGVPYSLGIWGPVRSQRGVTVHARYLILSCRCESQSTQSKRQAAANVWSQSKATEKKTVPFQNGTRQDLQVRAPRLRARQLGPRVCKTYRSCIALPEPIWGTCCCVNLP